MANTGGAKAVASSAGQAWTKLTCYRRVSAKREASQLVCELPDGENWVDMDWESNILFLGGIGQTGNN